MCVCVYISLCVSLGFFCLLAVSWNGLGLFLSGLIRGSRLHPSLITLLRANIPFIFSLFRSLSTFVVGELGRGSATYQPSHFLVLHLPRPSFLVLSVPPPLIAKALQVSSVSL